MNEYKLDCYFKSSLNEIPSVSLNSEALFSFKSHGTYCEALATEVSDGTIYEVVLYAVDDSIAKKATELLCAANTVASGFNYMDTDYMVGKIFCDADNPSEQVYYSKCCLERFLYPACLLVKAVYGNQRHMNAIIKYHVAHEVFSLHPMDLHPMLDPIQREYLLTEQIRISNTIVACYSTLEELGVELRLKEDEKSVNEKADGWNPEVFIRVKTTLSEHSIDAFEEIPWLSRNGISRPFKSKVVQRRAPCEWSNETDIQDFNVTIIDAILELSHIRSRIASHAVGSRVLKLTVYDAENAFCLARTILLSYFSLRKSTNAE